MSLRSSQYTEAEGLPRRTINPEQGLMCSEHTRGLRTASLQCHI